MPPNDASAGSARCAVRIKSPALWSWAPTMNLGDGFRIHVIHITRHARQIERLMKQL